MLKNLASRIQHVGIPTNDISKTVDFYKSLGFELAHQNEMLVSYDPNLREMLWNSLAGAMTALPISKEVKKLDI